MSEVINFADTKFLLKTINVPGFGDECIGTTDLEEKLMLDGNYINRQAQLVDEMVFFYVEPDEINLPNNQLAELVAKQVA